MESHSNPTHGTKVTTDRAGQINTIKEGAGPVTSDSLAAESVRSGGGFAANRDAEPLAVKGSNSTFNTTDTSAATELPPAAHGADREDREQYLQSTGSTRHHDQSDTPTGSGTGAGARAASGQGQDDHSTGKSQQQGGQQEGRQQGPQMTSGGGAPSSAQQSAGEGGSTDDASKQSGQGQAAENLHHGHHGGRKHHKHEAEAQGGAAPTYVEVDVLNRTAHAKPHGKNIKEGDVPDDAPNASFTGEIGSEDDPGRLALQGFERVNAESARDLGPRDKQLKGNTPYDPLGTDEPA